MARSFSYGTLFSRDSLPVNGTLNLLQARSDSVKLSLVTTLSYRHGTLSNCESIQTCDTLYHVVSILPLDTLWNAGSLSVCDSLMLSDTLTGHDLLSTLGTLTYRSSFPRSDTLGHDDSLQSSVTIFTLNSFV
jgi:hypothetical protein